MATLRMIIHMNRLLHSPLYIPSRNIKGILVPLPTGNIPETPIKWTKPNIRPLFHPERTGDGSAFLKLDMNKSPVLVEKSTEIQTANEYVKKMFTFQFLGRKYAVIRVRDEMIESVRNHEYDNSSWEARIASKTANIRNFLEYRETKPSDKKAKTYLNSQVGKRRKLLNQLRQYDYKRFEWLLEKLDLYYQPVPEHYFFRTRRKSIRQLTDDYCDALRNHRLLEYKQKLDNEKENFLKEKVETLEWIRKEELECGVTPSITEEEITSAKQQLDDHLKMLSQKVVHVNVSRNIMDLISEQ